MSARSDVAASSHPNGTSQPCVKDYSKGSHCDKDSSHVHEDSNLRRDREKRNSCFHQPPVSASGSALRFPLNTQSQTYRQTFKGKQALGTGQNLRFSRNNQETSGVSYNGYRDQYKKHERDGEYDSLVELKCGPRAFAKPRPPPSYDSSSSSSSLKQSNSFASALRKEMYNLPDFEIEYEDAKFFVIKSYSEDDVHKSIKYSVWSSTCNGNKKLDAAYRDAEVQTLEDGKKRPIFLFFSVNASRQFVGLAEMVGYVDFDKDLDFWQVDKWSGFFPVEWHVVKDVPNWDLNHIILDNNEGKPVTHTRDTHEIKLKEGLKMLAIFKKYSAVTSLVDDMDFYEEREKSLKEKKENKPATLRMDIYKEKEYDDYYEMEGDRRMNQDRRFNSWNRSSRTEEASLVNLTKNLSLRGYSGSSNNNFGNSRRY